MATPIGKLEQRSAIAGLLSGVLAHQQQRRDEARAAQEEATRQSEYRTSLQAAADREKQRALEAQQNILLRKRAQEEQKRQFDVTGQREQEAIKARGEQAMELERLRQQRPTTSGAAAPSPLDTQTKLDKAIASQINSLKDRTTFEGFNINDLEARHPGIIEDVVVESAVDPSVTRKERLMNGIAFDWADGLTNPNDPEIFKQSGFGPDLLQLGIPDGETPVISGAYFNDIMGQPFFADDQPVDLEDIAKVFVQNGASEQQYRDFVEQIVITPHLKDLRPQDKQNVILGTVGNVLNPRFGPGGLIQKFIGRSPGGGPDQ